jgi:hypothetical protein
MAVRTRIQPFEQSLRVLVDDTLSPAAQSRALAGFARATLAETQRQNQAVLRRVPPFRQFVDGAEGRSLDAVKPEGRIVFEFDVGSDVTAFIMGELERLSPVDSGAYRRSHFLFADGRQVLAGEAAPQAEEFIFLNSQPYARAIELGQMKMKVEGSSRVYQQVQRIAAGRFGNLASIRFSYRSPIGTATTGKAGRASRVPAIVVSLR